MSRFANAVAAMLGVAAAVFMTYAALAAFREEADVPAAVFAVLAVMWAVDAQAEIAEARKANR